ncbi:MAG: bifunctional glutathionylspermidine amidase/synthase [Halioglobus sp.]
MMSQPKAFGELLGIDPGGVPAYSSDYDSVDPLQMPDRHSFRNYVDGIYTGYKWQCVEFARRWLLQCKGYVFDDIAMAYDIFRLKYVRVLADQRLLPLHAFENGSRRHPEPGCMLIWNEGGEYHLTGHVAIVTEVFADRVRVAEQNVEHQEWVSGCDYARELPASIGEDGSYWIQCSFHNASILGWVIQTSDATDAVEFADPEPALFKLQQRELKPGGPAPALWLNPANADEAAYIAMNGHRLSSSDVEKLQYFVMSRTARQELKRATNELHALFMHATDYVLQNPALLEKFNLPPVIWPRLQQSWSNRRNQMVTGRFDFCMTEGGLKVFEYNADSASCHMECGKIQGLWAQRFGCDDGEDAGEDLFDNLVTAWQETEVDGLVHILLDHDQEEMYHALFMQSAMEQAGIECKLVKGLAGVQWQDAETVLDSDGIPIRWVWKTWAWETALDQLRQELDEDAQRQLLRQPLESNPPRLMDVLLRPSTMVFEPIWTLVPSNKAILPILWEMFPDHPYLLESRFQLTDALRAHGYVSKPIAGRCGHNISIVNRTEALLTETGGRFDEQQQVFQALCELPKIGHYRVQLSTFSAGGVYSGACVRVDNSLIITTDSDVRPLRVVSDREFSAAQTHARKNRARPAAPSPRPPARTHPAQNTDTPSVQSPDTWVRSFPACDRT